MTSINFSMLIQPSVPGINSTLWWCIAFLEQYKIELYRATYMQFSSIDTLEKKLEVGNNKTHRQTICLNIWKNQEKFRYVMSLKNICRY